MTTIAVNKDMMASDQQLSHASGAKFRSGPKMQVYDNPLIYGKKFVVGYAGNVETCLQIMDFFNNPVEWKLHKKWETVEFVVLTEDKKIYTFSDPRNWLPVREKYYAIGSGSHFAMGAMEAGKLPDEAVKVAIKLDKGSGMGISKIVL